MGTKKFTAKEVADAITQAKGFITVAARRLGCRRDTIYRYIKEYASVREAKDDAREIMLDITEGKLFEQIQEGNMTAIIFHLKTQGKGRGYIERQEIVGDRDSPVAIEIGLSNEKITEQIVEMLNNLGDANS
jgi:hypothetical protein|tara:strand:- start:52 stop:447 length:396 start_codon:yes stop_codon:yes gene_type:complete